ncbi:transcription factor TFIIIB component B'' [Nymphaea colorata]|nr:transcription factor TFIIIB component B'' [Nymphaea colorata]
MLSDLDAIDDALANAGARNASKFRPKVGKLLEKKAGKPSAAARNVDARMPKESASVPQTDSQLPTSQVDATHGVLTNGAMVTTYQSNEENLQGKQMLGSSFEAAYMGAEASVGIENAGESSFFSILHGTVPDVDAVAGDILGRPTNDAGTEEASNSMENPLVASSEDVCYDLDHIGITHTESANNGSMTAIQEENEHFTSSAVVCNVHSDTYSNQVGNVGRNSMMFDSQYVRSDLDDPNDVLADSVSTGSLLDNQRGQSFTPLQQDQLISNACNAIEEPPFSSYPFPQNAYDTNLEMGEADEREQAVGSSMNDELLGDVDKDEIFHAPDLDGETSRESKSIRKTRKRKDTPLSHIDEASAESKDELTGTAYEPSDSAGVDESGSDEDFSEGNVVKRKRVAKGKRQLPEEPKQKQKNHPNSKRKAEANEGPNSSKKEPKKKFSHSTRRTRKLMDETLLETPEDEINPRTLILKDLILLAEMKEKKLNKAAAVGSSVTPEGDAAGFEGVAGDGTFQRHSPSLNGDGDEINQTDESTRPKLNYHSYMKRTPSQRWSNADTELFYKALRQFGTDFEMIRKLFPGRTRHQVKLKYKKEERKHPLQLADALVNRSKDHTHFQLVIDQLQSQAESVSCKSTGSPDIDGQTGEADNHFKDYNNLGSHETRDIDEWSHEVFDNTSPDYVGKDDYSDYYQ